MSNVVSLHKKAPSKRITTKYCLGCGRVVPKLYHQPLCPTCKLKQGIK